MQRNNSLDPVVTREQMENIVTEHKRVCWLGSDWSGVGGSGKPFIRIPFESPEFCFECALELGDTFDMLQVIELRPGETMERIEEMIGVWLDRERVASAFG